MRIFRIVDWFQIMLGKTFHVLSLYMIMLIPIQFGFAYFSSVIVGPHISDYYTMLGSFTQQLIVMMGQQDSMAIMRNSYWFTIIWSMFFIILFAYFFITASIVAFEGGFDEAVCERGYP